MLEYRRLLEKHQLGERLGSVAVFRYDVRKDMND